MSLTVLISRHEFWRLVKSSCEGLGSLTRNQSLCGLISALTNALTFGRSSHVRRSQHIDHRTRLRIDARYHSRNVGVSGNRLAFLLSIAVSSSGCFMNPLPSSLHTWGLESPLSRSCSFTRWSKPRSVFATPTEADRALQFLNVAVGLRRNYVVGTNIVQFDGTPVSPSPLTAVELGGRDIGRPSGEWTFSMPTAVVDTEERLHVLWGEPQKPTGVLISDEWPPRRLSAIWGASYAPASGWSVPKEIFTAEDIFWGPGTIQNRLVSGSTHRIDRTTSEEIVLPVATLAQEPRHPLLLLRLQEEHWNIDSVTDGAVNAGVEPTFASDGTTQYLAFLAPDPTARVDANSVFVKRSSDGGRTWSSARLISRSGNFPAYSLRAAAVSPGIVHLVWLQETGNDRQRLRHSVSRDGGLTWSLIDEDGRLIPRKDLNAVADDCGNLYVTYVDWSAGPDLLRLTLIQWRGKWLSAEPLFAGWSHTLAC